MSAALEIRNLRAGYGGIEVLHGISFEVQAGTVTALLGANGAGKSTTLRALSGLTWRRGEMRFDGRSIADTSTSGIARLGVAHIPEGRGTFTKLSVEENLTLGGVSRRTRREIAADLERMYAWFPVLKTRRQQAAGLLSGGEQQMLAISRALMMRPRLLLLDEPSFGLAPRMVQEIFAIFAQLKAQEEISIVLVEQNAGLALELADRAYVLESGRVVLEGPADAVRRDERVRHAYLGA